MPKAYHVDQVIKKLLKYDSRFEVYAKKGKGSHRMIYHPNINGEEKSYPIKYHGKKTNVSKGTLSALKRRFDLPQGFF